MGFNLNDYEPVDSRLRKFRDKYPVSPMVTVWHKLPDETSKVAICEVQIFLDPSDGRPASCGTAIEFMGGKGANKDSAVENAETSARGRALAGLGMGGDLKASREEMEKVQRLENTPGKAPSRVTSKADNANLTQLKNDISAATSMGDLTAVATRANELGLFGNIRSDLNARAGALKNE